MNPENKNIQKITVDVNGLMEMLSVGRNSALAIGENAGAVIRVGRRKLYSVEKIKEYMNERLEG